jgi:hypothetical protein
MPPIRTHRPVDPWIDRIAWLMDRSIPIGPWRIGLDGIAGLVPGIGDYLGAIVSAVIVLRASMLGIPKGAVARMVTNVLVDSLLGAIPIVGDAFDFVFKANTKNLAILEESLAGTRSGRRDWAVVGVALLAVVAILAIPLYALAQVWKWF